MPVQGLYLVGGVCCSFPVAPSFAHRQCLLLFLILFRNVGCPLSSSRGSWFCSVSVLTMRVCCLLPSAQWQSPFITSFFICSFMSGL
eukprot:671663-Pelagomonas_calceolata.AAC.2